jgi:hypothetical protein
MLQRFADLPGPISRLEQMEVQELAYQQRRIQEGLRDLLASFPDLLAALPEEAQYAPLRRDVNDFIQAVAGAKIEEDLNEGARALAALDAKTGFTLAQRAAEKMDRLIAKCCAGLGQQAHECLHFEPTVMQGLGNTLDQILAAMGANRGSGQGAGQGGSNGYSLFNDEIALYGANVQLAGDQGGGRRENAPAGSRRAERVPGDAREPGLGQAAPPARVRLQPDAKFPLRYRELVGEYFRVIAETQAEGDQ